jgi:hypothetical protein
MMDEVIKLLASANTAMVAVTFALCQVLKRVLPSPPPEVPGAAYDPWKVAKRFAWMPFAAAFLIGLILSIVFDPHQGQRFIDKVADGLQTGAYSVVTWELWSNVKKLFGDT